MQLAPTQKQPPSKQTEEEYIALTYRSGIIKLLPTTYYNSDSGWGCMLRVGQMFLANLYYKKEKINKISVIKLFHDNNPTHFSIQMFTQAAKKIYENKKEYDWFSPCQCGFVIKELIQPFDNKYRVSICNDNCLFLSDIQADRSKLIVLLMCRIGLDEPQPEYLECILRFFKFKHFNSILGGTPNKAHLFLRHIQQRLGFLDPHKTQKVVPYQSLQKYQQQYTSTLMWIPQQRIDSSMSIAFIIPKQQLLEFWEEMEITKQELGQKFFIYLDKQRPVYNSDDEGIIEIIDDDDDF